MSNFKNNLQAFLLISIMSIKDFNQEIKSIFSSALTLMKKSHLMQVIIAERVLSAEFWFSSDIFTFQQYLPALFP